MVEPLARLPPRFFRPQPCYDGRVTPGGMTFTVAVRLGLLVLVARSAGATGPATAPASEPATITLHLANADPQAVVQALARQVSAPIPVVPPDLFEKNALPTVTIDVERQGFWAALREVGRKTGLEPFT